jgi:hypothetical protein
VQHIWPKFLAGIILPHIFASSILKGFFVRNNLLLFLFLKITTLYPNGIRSHNPIAPVSSVAGGDDTTRPLRQGQFLYETL